MGFPKELFLRQDGIEEFTCAICLDIIGTPTQISECKHSFCVVCITKWFATQIKNALPDTPNPNPTCPACRCQIKTRLIIKDGKSVIRFSLIPNREIMDKLINLRMRCEFALCGVISKYADYEKHKMELHQKELLERKMQEDRRNADSTGQLVIRYRFIDFDGSHSETFEFNE